MTVKDEIISFPEIALLVDVENISSNLLVYALNNAKRVAPVIYLVSEWEYFEYGRSFKKWIALIKKKYTNIQFIQVERKVLGKDSLDIALDEMSVKLLEQGIKCFMILSNDSYFARVALDIRQNPQNMVIGVGTNKAGKKLQAVYDKFLCYTPRAGLEMLPTPLVSVPAPLPGKNAPLLPDREAGLNLVKAYHKGKKGADNWLSLTRLASAFKLMFPTFSFPPGHPSKFLSIVKIYHEYLRYEVRGNEVFVYPTEEYFNYENDPALEEQINKNKMRQNLLQGAKDYLENAMKMAQLLADPHLVSVLNQARAPLERPLATKTVQKKNKNKNSKGDA